jgi:transcriptional regulator with XRE-family HTH domain
LRSTVCRMAKALQAPRYQALPKLLRDLREAAGLTQRDLGNKLAISHTLVHASERAERRVDIAEFCDWCFACGVDPLDVMKQFLKKR